MAVTARDFSDALKAAMVAEKPLLLTLIDGHQHRVLLPVSITENQVEFAAPHIGHQIVVAWNEIASLEVAGQAVAPHDRLTALLLKAELSEAPCDPTGVAVQPMRAFRR